MSATPTAPAAVHRAAGRLRRLLSRIGGAVRAAHGRPSPSDMTSAARQRTGRSVPRGRPVRFPFPPALFAVPLAAALAADRRVIRLPLPGAGSAALTRVGIAVGAAGIAPAPPVWPLSCGSAPRSCRIVR